MMNQGKKWNERAYRFKDRSYQFIELTTLSFRGSKGQDVQQILVEIMMKAAQAARQS